MLTLTANKNFFLQKLFIKKFDTVVSWSSQGEWIIWLFVLRLIIRNLKVEQQEKRNDHHQKLSRPSSNNKQKFKLAQAHYETIRLNVCRSVWPRLTQHGKLDILNTKKHWWSISLSLDIETNFQGLYITCYVLKENNPVIILWALRSVIAVIFL